MLYGMLGVEGRRKFAKSFIVKRTHRGGKVGESLTRQARFKPSVGYRPTVHLSTSWDQ